MRAARVMIGAVLAGVVAASAGGVVRGQAVGLSSGVVTGTTLRTSTLTTGTVLDARAAMSPDGRYVTMTVTPSLSALEGFETFIAPGVLNQPQVVGLTKLPFRPAVVGKVTFVDKDSGLLARSVRPATWKNVSLKEAAQKLADASGSNVVLGIRGLQDAKIDVNAPHTFAISAGTMKAAVLELMKEAAPETDVVVTSDDNVVAIATQAQADRAVVTRTYRLDDLIANLPRIISAQTDLRTMRAEAPARNGVAGKAVVAGNAIAAGGQAAAQKAAPANPDTDLIRLITLNVRPDIWKVNGGTIGEIAISGKYVMVTAPQSVQAILQGPSHERGGTGPLYVGYGQ